jgi:hypothetical protein
MKIFMILFVCIQNAAAPLDQTCIIEEFYKPYNSINQCLAYANSLSSSTPKDVYMTAFCTEKEII